MPKEIDIISYCINKQIDIEKVKIGQKIAIPITRALENQKTIIVEVKKIN